jgi:hypothetical protein
LKTNCKNPELLCHAGLIYAKSGKDKEAKILLEEGLKNNPVLPVLLETESKKILKASPKSPPKEGTLDSNSI